MKSLRSALIFIGVVGFSLGLLLAALVVSGEQSGTPELDAALILAASWSFLGTGLFAWWRRPNNRTGAWMTATGYGWLLIALSMSENSWMQIVGIMFSNVIWVMLAQLLLIFPTGNFESQGHRTIIRLLYADVIILPAIAVLFRGDAVTAKECPDCSGNPIALADNQNAYNWIDNVTAVIALVLMGFLIAALIHRYRAMNRVNLSAFTPVLAVGGFALAALALVVGLQLVGVDDAITQPIFMVSITGLILIPYAFLFGLLRSKFSAAGAVSELIATLGDRAQRELQIRDALAEALDDPSLQFAYWLPEREIYVDDEGLQLTLPVDGREVQPVEYDGELIAAIIYSSSPEEKEQLIRATGSAAALALRNQRLEAELRAKVEELRASRARIVEASDAVRRQLERDLHDGAQQHLVSMALMLRMAQDMLDSDPQGARDLLAQTSANLADATTELRELARGIHPAILTDRGLVVALDSLASRAPIPVRFKSALETRLPPAVESAAYFVVAEALTNVARYAEASTATVNVTRANGLATIEVRDDGIGGATIEAGSGLSGLQDRVAALDGRLKIESPPNAGTIVTAEFPCA